MATPVFSVAWAFTKTSYLLIYVIDGTICNWLLKIHNPSNTAQDQTLFEIVLNRVSIHFRRIIFL